MLRLAHLAIALQDPIIHLIFLQEAPSVKGTKWLPFNSLLTQMCLLLFLQIRPITRSLFASVIILQPTFTISLPRLLRAYSSAATARSLDHALPNWTLLDGYALEEVGHRVGEGGVGEGAVTSLSDLSTELFLISARFYEFSISVINVLVVHLLERVLLTRIRHIHIS